MVIRSVDDVERDRKLREINEIKQRTVKSLEEGFREIFKHAQINRKPKKVNYKWKVVKWFSILFLVLILSSVLLGSVWLLKLLIKSLFFGV